jgi:hypothetical protein
MTEEPYIIRPLKWAHCTAKSWLSKFTTLIEVTDEGAGEYVRISQPFTNSEPNGCAFTEEEWKTLKPAIDHAFAQIKRHE